MYEKDLLCSLSALKAFIGAGKTACATNDFYGNENRLIGENVYRGGFIAYNDAITSQINLRRRSNKMKKAILIACILFICSYGYFRIHPPVHFQHSDLSRSEVETRFVNPSQNIRYYMPIMQLSNESQTLTYWPSTTENQDDDYLYCDLSNHSCFGTPSEKDTSIAILTELAHHPYDSIADSFVISSGGDNLRAKFSCDGKIICWDSGKEIWFIDCFTQKRETNLPLQLCFWFISMMNR